MTVLNQWIQIIKKICYLAYNTIMILYYLPFKFYHYIVISIGKERKMKGYTHIYCGDGKGKTTCATGLAIRAAGNQMNVLFLQFLKNNQSCELKILNQIDQIDIISCKKEFGFFWNMTEEQKKEARQAYTALLQEAIQKATSEFYDMIVLDEIMATLSHNLIEETILLDFIRNKPESLEIVMTGRNPSENLLELADYVSEIKKIKHPYDKGIFARKGIEM